jgi:hypothetical protein
MIVLPLLYVFTPWLSFADYRLPSWASWAGVIVFAAALGLLWRSQADLGRSWMGALAIKAEHAWSPRASIATSVTRCMPRTGCGGLRKRYCSKTGSAA